MKCFSSWGGLILLALVCVEPVRAEPPPVEHFAQLPVIDEITLSPKGQHLAYLLNRADLTVLFSSTLEGAPKPLLQTDNEKYRFTWIRWLNEEWILAGVRYPDTMWGVRNVRTGLMRINARTGKSYDGWRSKNSRLKPNQEHYPQHGANVISFLPEDPDHFLLQLDIRNPTYPGVYRINVKNGSRKMVQGPKEPVRSWMADQQGRVRIREALEEGESIAEFYSLAEKDWKPLWRYRPLVDPPQTVLGFGNDPNTLYVRELEQGFNAIFTVDLADPELTRELVASDSDDDMNGGLIYSPLTNEPVGLARTNDRGTPIYWDADFKRFQQAIDRALPDSTNWIQEFSEDLNRYILKTTSHRRPPTYFLGDRSKGSLAALASDYPELEKLELSGKTSFTYTAADGLKIEAYITEPWGEVPKPWPTVVFPHGGPHARNYKSFDYWSEFFASRGYAVLQMNFRGSTGYGWNFMKQGIQNIGREMQTDIVNGVQQLIAKGIADASKICIVGASYGGYAALWGTISTPELFQCAISFAGVTDWGAVLRRSRRFTNEDVVKAQLGNAKLLKEVSVLENADKINLPVLLLHGDRDRVVEPVHSRKLASKLQRLNRDFSYVELKDGTHNLGKQENRTRVFEEMDQFLARHLAGD